MHHYVARRLLLSIVTVWFVISLVFLAVRALPGDFITISLASQANLGAEIRDYTVPGEHVVEATLHRVVQGDTARSIARTAGVELSVLLALNPQIFTPDGDLELGDPIVVVDGESLGAIAERYQVDPAQIIARNPALALSDRDQVVPAGTKLNLQAGLTVAAIARTNRITAADILEANPFGSDANPDGTLGPESFLPAEARILLPLGKIQEAKVRHRLGMDAPLGLQYVRYLWDTVRLDFGASFQTNRSAIAEVLEVLPRTIQLGLLTLLVAMFVSIPVGILSAVHQDRWPDYALRGFAILALAAPPFWIATIVIYLATPGGVFASGIWEIPFTNPDARNLWNAPGEFFKLYAIPAMAGGIASGAILMRITRSSLLEALRKDYIRAAAAKGLMYRTIVLRHALKNSLIPVLTVIGLAMSVLIGGTVIMETLFGIPGVGVYFLSRIEKQDIPPIQTVVLVFAVFTILVNLLIDVLYAFVDPRIRYS